MHVKDSHAKRPFTINIAALRPITDKGPIWQHFRGNGTLFHFRAISLLMIFKTSEVPVIFFHFPTISLLMIFKTSEVPVLFFTFALYCYSWFSKLQRYQYSFFTFSLYRYSWFSKLQRYRYSFFTFALYRYSWFSKLQRYRYSFSLSHFIAIHYFQIDILRFWLFKNKNLLNIALLLTLPAHPFLFPLEE